MKPKKAFHQNQAGLTSDVYTSSPEHRSTTVDSTIKHAGSAACEHAKEIDQRDQYELNKNIAQNQEFPMGDRAQGAVDAFGNKISEKAHEAKKAFHQNQAGLTSDVYTSSPEHKPTVDSTIKHAGNAALEQAKEIERRDQFEMNKNLAQNPDLPLGDRAQGAVDAFGNKISEKAHEAKKAFHQNQAGLTSDVYTSSPEHKSPTVDSTIKHAGNAALEQAKEIDQRDQYEINKNIAQNPDLPFGERAQGAAGAVGNKITEKTHEAKKAFHQNQAGLTSDVYTSSPEHKPTISSNIKSAGIAATEHSKEIDQKAQYHLNKEIAKNPDLPMAERTQAALGTIGNKVSEKAHEANKAVHQKHSVTTEATGSTSTTSTELPSASLSSPTSVPVSPPLLPTQPVPLTKIPAVPTSPVLSTTADSTIKHAGLAAQEHAQELHQKGQYEVNKNIAGNTELPLGERTQAAFEAVGNKISEKTHEVKKAIHQNQAGLKSKDTVE